MKRFNKSKKVLTLGSVAACPVLHLGNDENKVDIHKSKKFMYMMKISKNI